MKPLTLYLTNFKSYSQDAPILDFNLFDVALITGENGYGKSSLADAIAWCVWGQCKGMDARGGVDDLVRTGADEMEVVFSFEEEGNIYKIVRKRDKRRGQSALDFMIKSGDGFVPISGNRIGETQQKIQEVIKLDYDTYLCTGYLSQGKADLFAIKKPSERKEILAEILNLSAYEKLERKALDKKNQTQNRLDWLERELNILEQTIGGKDRVAAQIEEMRGTLGSLQEKEATFRERLAGLYHNRQEKEAIRKKVEDYENVIHREQKEIESLKKDKTNLEKRLDGYAKVLERELEIVEDYHRLRQLEQQAGVLAHKFQLTAELVQRRERLEGDMRVREQDMNHRIKMIQREMSQQRAKMDQEERLRQQWELIEKDLEKFNALEEESGKLEEDLTDLTQDMANLTAKENTLNKQLNEVRERYNTLQNAEFQCPTCGKPLEGHHKNELMEEMTQQAKSIKQWMEENRAAIAELQKQRKHKESRIRNIRTKMRGRGKLEGQAALVTRQLEEVLEAGQKMKDLTQQLLPLTEQLESKSYLQDLTQQLEELQQDMVRIGYKPQVHRTVQEQIKKLHKTPREWESVQKARAQMASDSESLERVIRFIGDRKKHLKEVEGLIQDLKKAAEDLPNILLEITRLEEIMQGLQGDIRSMEARRGALEERWSKIRSAEEDKQQKKHEQKELCRQLEVFKALALIYGKRGIQAAIIENAIPELQDEANRILAKITDGRLVVEFLTQRDTKTGNIMETLDIKISDGMDTRKYETYSGGEEFRINFAIRIALAKILANRAGANLRMLILDEGFGALDEQGRERLVEVINAIRDEFDKILVITHIPELKDSFPVQIEVFKTSAGSAFKMVG
jgi:exonuclease SbcC